MSNFFKAAQNTQTEVVNPQASNILAKVFASASGGILTDSDQAWNSCLRAVRQEALNYGFQSVELGPIEEAVVYEKTVQLKSSEEVPVLEWQNKTFVVRFNALYSLLRVYHAAIQGRSQALSKWYSIFPGITTGPKGALMTDWQLAIAAMGEFSVVVEAQLVCALWEMCRTLGLEDKLQLEVNNIGNAEAQKNYATFLAQYLQPKRYNLCDNCGEHLSNNPIQILRCRQLDCQAVLSDGPVVLDSLDDESQKRLTQFLESLEELGIPYQLNPTYAGPKMAQGTCFALKVKTDSGYKIFAEGFRVNDLSSGLSGKSYNGFAATASLSVLREAVLAHPSKPVFEVYLVPLGDMAIRKSLRLMRDLVVNGVSVYDFFGNNGVKNQLKNATDSKGRMALIMGQREAADEKVILRDIVSGIQETFSFEQIVEEVKKRLGR